MSPGEHPAPPLSFGDLDPGLELPATSVTVELGQVQAFRDLIGVPSTRDPGDAVPASLLVAVVLERATGSGPLSGSDVVVTSHELSLRRPVDVGETLTLSTLVTHRLLDGDGIRGTVGLYLELADDARSVVLDGEATVSVATSSAEAARDLEARRPSFASPRWLDALADALSVSKTFAEATTPFDGSMAFDFGAGAVGIRVYRGRVIDRGGQLVKGATFTVGAPPATWLRFASRSRNEFISFAMSGAFDVLGSTYEYLRMTRALIVATDEVRNLISGSTPPPPPTDA